MVRIVLFHHVQGLTSGVKAFADELRQAGHSVHTLDLFDARTFPTLEAAAVHLFADSSLPSYDEEATRLLTGRALDFLARLEDSDSG